MEINQQATVARVRSRSGPRRRFVFPRTKRTTSPVWSNEAEVLRALGECRPSPRGSPSRRTELPLQRPWF
jgi:hypothetical protein